MASSSGRKTSSSRKSTSKTKSSSRSRNTRAQQAAQDSALFHEIGLIILFVVMVILFCCNFGIIGPVGNAISGVLFGLFGFTAYIAPILLFVAIAFWFANEGNPTAVRKMIAGVVLFIMLGVVCDLIAGNAVGMEDYDIKVLYTSCSEAKKGGGVIAGSLSFVLLQYLETIGTILVVFLCSTISLILLTEKSLLKPMRSGGSRIRERSREDAERRREYAQIRRKEQAEARSIREERREEERALREERREEERARREEERRIRAEEKENEKILRMEKKVTGVMMDTAIRKPEEERRRDDMHEIMYSEQDETVEEGMNGLQSDEVVSAVVPTSIKNEKAVEEPVFDFDRIQIRSAHQVTLDSSWEEEERHPIEEQDIPAQEPEDFHDPLTDNIRVHKEGIEEPVPEQSVTRQRPVAKMPEKKETSAPVGDMSIHKDIQAAEKKLPVKYMFPPLSRLQKGNAATGDSTRELKETAMRLQQTLNTFGVKVTITDISQGPSVTRYELQPEQGVKVSKIVGLSDDIKLNLAATDIRIEAPIPGKAAIGIEVPNKENMMVALRDLFESKEFKEFPSNLAFAVGKDIAGKTVVADIAKMPHMLIAGATGSGKSVCINTLIMSILYKAHPDDVKLIMVDPKVVELSVYNGIPHLLIPVVTDPKKASAALHWGVSEMEDRYRKFADFNVRDLKGYNAKVESMREKGDENAPAKLP